MVHLNRIYTKVGDTGRTALGNGVPVPKTHPRISASGCVDELNATVGVCLTTELPSQFAEWLRSIQNDLFDVGADLCVPETDTPSARPALRVTSEYISRIESWIDDVNQKLEPLNTFVLPGGTPAAAHLHLARTVCRRAERVVWQLAQQETVNAHVPIYLNRLSDALFVLARACNAGHDEPGWNAGGPSRAS